MATKKKAKKKAAGKKRTAKKSSAKKSGKKTKRVPSAAFMKPMTPSAQRSFLHMINGAKRPETREKRVKQVIDYVARKVSMSALREQAMGGKKAR